MRSRYRSLSAALLVIVFSALAGGFFGRGALVAQDQVPDQYKVFTAALSAVEGNYVGEVESDRLVYGAITGMLQTLDPHSSFFDPKAYAQMRERQEGRYYGLGISIGVSDGDITVVTPIADLLGEWPEPATGAVVAQAWRWCGECMRSEPSLLHADDCWRCGHCLTVTYAGAEAAS